MTKLYTLLPWMLLVSFFMAGQNTKISSEGENLEQLIHLKFGEAKKILKKDNGNLWGHSIWNDSILIIDTKTNSVWSTLPLDGATKSNNALYRLEMENNELNYVNTVQKFRGHDYVTVMDTYLGDDHTLIHELFHKMHFGLVKDLTADPIDYLDGYQARIYMRSEFTALKNVMEALNRNAKEDSIKTYIHDAFIFRKLRQQQNSEWIQKAIELETVEGLAVYTAFKLSKIPNKYLLTEKEIDQRVSAASLTRSFAYATGPAYGLIFDYLNMDWRTDLERTRAFNFLEIYETSYLGKELSLGQKVITDAESRNNHNKIKKEETARKEEREKTTRFYESLFFEQKTITVKIEKPATGFNMSYDMNGTFVLGDKGTVYTTVAGEDTQKKYFGSFELKSELGKGGALFINGTDHYLFVFPYPTKIEKQRLVGDNYHIEINPGWKVIEKDQGNLEIIPDN